MNFVPSYSKVVIKPDTASDKSSGGIYYAPGAEGEPSRGEVVAINEYAVVANQLLKHGIKVGEIALYDPEKVQPIEVGEEKYVVVNFNDIIGWFRETS